LSTLNPGLVEAPLERWSWKDQTGYVVSGWRSPGIGQKKPVLVFLHGNGFAPKIYMPLLSMLCKHFDLFLPEIPLHGEAGAQSRFMGWNSTSAIYGRLVDSFASEWSQWFLSGHSFGGVLAILLARRTQRPPKKLVLLDPIILPRRYVWIARIQRWLGLTRFHPMVAITRKRRQQFTSFQEAYAYFEGRGAFRGWTRDALSAYVLFNLKSTGQGVELITPPAAECDIYSSYAWGLRSDLSQLTTPCHILIGNETFPYQQRAVRETVASYQALSSELVEGGHCFMQQFPEETVKRLLSYVNNNENEVSTRS